jgi:hypothetical protein
MIVGDNNGLGLEISNLNIEFDIDRSYKIESNTANFKVYNASKETRDKILTVNNNIILKAGYKDEETGIIFNGIIFDAHSKKKKTEWITTIIANDYGANNINLYKTTINNAYKEGIPISMVINDIVGVLGITVNGLQNCSDIYMNNAKVFSGLLKDVMKNISNILKVHGVGIYFDSNEMVVYKLGEQISTFGIVNLTPQNGLIGEVEEITDNSKEDTTNSSNNNKIKKRYAAISLMNAKIKPNTLIRLESENVNGLFIVEKVNFVGDNFGGSDFGCRIEVTE